MKTLAISSLLLLQATAFAAGDPAAGEAKTKPCAPCHGENGISISPMWPNLAGLNTAYFIDRMQFFQGTSVEQYPAMFPLSSELTQQDVEDLAAFYKSLSVDTCQAQSPQAGGDPAAGAQKAVACVACHGAAAVSANPAWPSLAGQKDVYLVAQLKAFKEGKRQNELMAPFAAALSEQDMEDVAAYYSGLNALDHTPCDGGS